MYAAVLPSHTRAMSPSNMAGAKKIAAQIAQLVANRPCDSMPAGIWAPEISPLQHMYRRVRECDAEAIGQLRAFCHIFTGFNLYEMRDAGGTLMLHPDRFPDTDIALDRNLPFIDPWRQLVADLPIQCRFVPPRQFGEIGHDVCGIIVNYDTRAYQERVNLLWKAGITARLDGISAEQGEIRILEIGGGYGALAYWFKSTFPSCSYTIIDLPESLLFSSLYLCLSRPDLRAGWSLEPVPFGLRFIPNYRADQMHEAFDLIINTASMSEMSEEQVRYYARQMKRHWLRENGMFFEQNQDNRHLGFLNASDILADELPWREPIAPFLDMREGPANLWSLRGGCLHS